jgi:hypothetical protein
MESFLAHPDIESLKQFAVNHRFMVDDSSPEIYASFNDFQQTFVALQHNPGNMEAMQQAVNFVNAYHEHFLNIPVVVGASGAIYGLLLAFGMLFPNSLIYLYFFIPMKAKWFVILFGGIELISGFYDQGSNIAHFAHLGGMIFGFLLIIYWRKKSQNHFNQWQ